MEDFLDTALILKLSGYIVNTVFPYMYVFKKDYVVTTVEIINILSKYSFDYVKVEQLGTLVVIRYE